MLLLLLPLREGLLKGLLQICELLCHGVHLGTQVRDVCGLLLLLRLLDDHAATADVGQGAVLTGALDRVI